MSISSEIKNDLMDGNKFSKLSKILGSHIVKVKEIKNSNNCRVDFVLCENKKGYAIKSYYPFDTDKRDRMYIEYTSLQSLWRNGVKSIPKPIAINRAEHFAVYSFIEGSSISSNDVGENDIDCATNFLKKLYGLKLTKESNSLPLASEACFSVHEIVNNIEMRYNNLIALYREEELGPELHEFLEKEFIKRFYDIVNWTKIKLTEKGGSYVQRLDSIYWTLSPSDFGFHNAIRKDNGDIVFLDFEHFGWDDPAKLISDFLFHPKMNLDLKLKKKFVDNMLSIFSSDNTLKYRFEILYPLFALKWCLICLNEFLPNNFMKRKFAYRQNLDKIDILKQQLLKAKKILDIVEQTYKEFPYK